MKITALKCTVLGDNIVGRPQGQRSPQHPLTGKVLSRGKFAWSLRVSLVRTVPLSGDHTFFPWITLSLTGKATPSSAR